MNNLANPPSFSKKVLCAWQWEEAACSMVQLRALDLLKCASVLKCHLPSALGGERWNAIAYWWPNRDAQCGDGRQAEPPHQSPPQISITVKALDNLSTFPPGTAGPELGDGWLPSPVWGEYMQLGMIPRYWSDWLRVMSLLCFASSSQCSGYFAVLAWAYSAILFDPKRSGRLNNCHECAHAPADVLIFLRQNSSERTCALAVAAIFRGLWWDSSASPAATTPSYIPAI